MGTHSLAVIYLLLMVGDGVGSVLEGVLKNFITAKRTIITKGHAWRKGSLQMAKETVPCIVCNRALLNVVEDADNQPEDGTALWTWGHYGSTAFDPMDGQTLEFNICDPCLLSKANEGKVLLGRTHRLILCEGRLVGREKVDRPLVAWNGTNHGGGDTEVDVLRIQPEEVGTNLGSNVEWFERA